MTPEQLVTFGAHIRANEDAAIVAAVAAKDYKTIAGWYNQPASPDCWVFVSAVSVDEVRRSLDWDEIEDDTKMTPQRQFMFNVLFANGSYEPPEVNNRQALIRIFPTAMPNCRAAVLADATEKATRAEQVFAVAGTGPGGGNGSAQAQSAVRGWQGEVDNRDVDYALEATA